MMQRVMPLLKEGATVPGTYGHGLRASSGALQMRKQRHREVKRFAQGHTARKRQSLCSTPKPTDLPLDQAAPTTLPPAPFLLLCKDATGRNPGPLAPWGRLWAVAIPSRPPSKGLLPLPPHLHSRP